MRFLVEATFTSHEHAGLMRATLADAIGMPAADISIERWAGDRYTVAGVVDDAALEGLGLRALNSGSLAEFKVTRLLATYTSRDIKGWLTVDKAALRDGAADR